MFIGCSGGNDSLNIFCVLYEWLCFPFRCIYIRDRSAFHAVYPRWRGFSIRTYNGDCMKARKLLPSNDLARFRQQLIWLILKSTVTAEWSIFIFAQSRNRCKTDRNHKFISNEWRSIKKAKKSTQWKTVSYSCLNAQ